MMMMIYILTEEKILGVGVSNLSAHFQQPSTYKSFVIKNTSKLNVHSKNNSSYKKKIDFLGVIDLFQVCDDLHQMLNEKKKYLDALILLPARKEFENFKL